MKLFKLTPLCVCFLFCLSKIHAQTISYQNIPSFFPTTCLFNSPPGPGSPLTIGGLSHYGIVGGVDYTGNELVLPVDATGAGSGFGIYYPMTTNYKYTIKVTAKATSGTVKLLWALNQFRSGTPSSCSPGFASIITQSATVTSSITGMGTSYTEYTLEDSYTPPDNNIHYLLFSDYNTAAVIGSTQIQSVTIIATPICYAPTVNDAVVLGGGQVQVQYTPPAFTAPITGYDIHMNRFDIITNPFPIIIPTNDNFTFSNVGTSPVTVTVTPTGYYSIWMTSTCPTGSPTSIKSNAISKTVN